MTHDAHSHAGSGSRVSLTAVRRHRTEILRLATEHGVRNVRLFGSVARGEATDHSDVDFLVDLAPGQSLLDLGAFQMDVQDLLGRRVDMVTTAGLGERGRDQATEDALPL